MKHRRQAGVTLFELLLVVSIILIISALSIPNILRAGQRAHEVSAVAQMRTLQTSQETFRVPNQQYADRFAQMPEMAVPNRAGEIPAPGSAAQDVLVRQNYVFTLRRPTRDDWTVTAEPVRDRRNSKFFYIDRSGTIRYAVGQPAGAGSATWRDDMFDASNRPEKE